MLFNKLRKSIDLRGSFNTSEESIYLSIYLSIYHRWSFNNGRKSVFLRCSFNKFGNSINLSIYLFWCWHGNTKRLIEKHIYSSNRNKIQVNLVKQLLVNRKLRVQWGSDYLSLTQVVSHVIVSRESGQLLWRSVDVYLWRRGSPLCKEHKSIYLSICFDAGKKKKDTGITKRVGRKNIYIQVIETRYNRT